MRRLAITFFAFLGLLWAGEAQAVCKLPYVLNNGTVTDAVKVMADLNALANCSGGGGIGNCSPTAPGSVPATGGGTTNFLRADCTFAEPSVTLIDCSGDHHALQSTTANFICVTDVAQFDKNQTWTANQAMPPRILTPGATITWDGLDRNYYKVTLDANGETLAAGTNVQPGNYTFFIYTGAGFTGFSTDVSFKWIGGTPIWSTAAGKEDVISCLVDDALVMACFAGIDTGGGGGGLSLTSAHFYVGNASNVATDVPASGDLTLANTGAFTIANAAVTNAKLLNAATTVNGRTCTLGSTCTLTNSDIGATLLATGTSVSLTAPREYYVCTSTCTVTPPVPAAGYEFCVMNDDNVATAITLAALGSSARYENTARTAYGTAGTGTLVSTAAAASKVCLLGLDSTHYLTTTFTGSWTAS